jgi:hypothetical protein
MEKVTISVALFNQIAQYLETKPFNEVSRFFVELQKEISAQQQPPEAPPAE